MRLWDKNVQKLYYIENDIYSQLVVRCFMKISKLADYSVVILGAMASQSHDVMSSSTVTELTRLPEPTVSKVLKLLSKSDFVRSSRGINGGYALIKQPDEITVEQIIRAIDGPIALTACVDGAKPDCSLSSACAVRGRWDSVNTAIKSALEMVTLADMMKISGAKPANTKEKEDTVYGSH